MTITELEQRVLALEEAVAQLKCHLSPNPETSGERADLGDAREDELIPGVEYPIVLDVPPRSVFHFRGKLIAVEEGRQEFGLSPEEWASLQLENDRE
jgi:hypothetical protein